MANTATKEVPVAEKAAFYHFGMLPATGPVKLWIPSRTEMKEEEVTFDPYELWNGCKKLGDDVQMFVAKMRQLNGITVRGWHFHATSQAAEARGGNVNRVDYPGQVAWKTPIEIRKIVKACFTSFVRYEHGLQKASDVRAKFHVYDATFWDRPKNMSDEAFAKYDANANTAAEKKEFDPQTDRLVADYVYVTRLAYDRSKLDMGEYEHNPNKFHVQMVPQLSREFFSDPPKSVAEMYPEGDK